MPRLRRKHPDSPYPDDVAYLVQQCLAAGYVVAPVDAQWAWGEYCEDYYCAGWLDPRGTNVVTCLLHYLEPEPDP